MSSALAGACCCGTTVVPRGSRSQPDSMQTCLMHESAYGGAALRMPQVVAGECFAAAAQTTRIENVPACAILVNSCTGAVLNSAHAAALTKRHGTCSALYPCVQAILILRVESPADILFDSGMVAYGISSDTCCRLNHSACTWRTCL